MGALVGLGVGCGLLLVWSAFALPRTERGAAPVEGRIAQLLARAGLADVSVTGFVLLCALTGVLTAFVMQLVSGTAPIALAFGAMAGWLPVATVTARARRRQREFAEVWPLPSTSSRWTTR